jgi:hypothetical protein
MDTKARFQFDTRDVEWRDFITDGCFYKLLNVDLDARQADMLVKFEPNSECLYHRHAAPRRRSCSKASCASASRPRAASGSR